MNGVQAGLSRTSALQAMQNSQPAYMRLVCRQAVRLDTQVDITDLPDIKSGFTVTFRFAEGNTLFANRELRKEYRFMEDGMLMVTGTEIDWLVVRRPATLPVVFCACMHAQLHAGTCERRWDAETSGHAPALWHPAYHGLIYVLEKWPAASMYNASCVACKRARSHPQAGNAASAPSQPSGLAAGAGAGAAFMTGRQRWLCPHSLWPGCRSWRWG